MAYVHNFREMPLLSSAGQTYVDLMSGTAANQVNRYAPGYQPIQVFAVGLDVLTSTALVTAPTVRFYYSSVAGGTSANWTALATFTLTTAARTTPQVYYKDGLTQVVRPGTEILCKVDTMSTQACVSQPTIYYYPLRQDPAQNSLMLASG